ncbi:hypothetical protein GUJ93_ZPchr0010g10493 [Zizania palustris]|uniref:Uncharacterized protein n=1 Tax=Zizania palustris TaxID=103762 RepID=A0A8J6BRQ0_ZIZPA|nr:hypothetical protein GUJ93_ZPchr0010g10493 [Zizania palustris]
MINILQDITSMLNDKILQDISVVLVPDHLSSLNFCFILGPDHRRSKQPPSLPQHFSTSLLPPQHLDRRNAQPPPCPDRRNAQPYCARAGHAPDHPTPWLTDMRPAAPTAWSDGRPAAHVPG